MYMAGLARVISGQDRKINGYINEKITIPGYHAGIKCLNACPGAGWQ